MIVDTLGRCLPPAVSGESPYSRDYRVMSALKDLVDAAPGSALLLAHHDRKAVTADFVDSLSGTNGIAGGADSVLVLTRGRGEAAGLLQVTGRDVWEGAYAVNFTGGRWALDGASLDEAANAATERRASAGLSDRSADVLGLVAKQPNGVRAGDVAAALGLGEATARTYLSRLAEAGRIDRPERGLYLPVASVSTLRPDVTPIQTQQGGEEAGP